MISSRLMPSSVIESSAKIAGEAAASMVAAIAKRSACMSTPQDGFRARLIACSRSSIRSWACSSPMDSRIRLPGERRCAPSTEARCSIRLSMDPRLVASVNSRVACANAMARCSGPRKRNDSSAPKADICRFAVAWPASVGRPG